MTGETNPESTPGSERPFGHVSPGEALRAVPGSLGSLFVAGGLGASTVGFFGGLWWALDLVAHFRAQLAVGLVAGAALAALAARAWLCWAGLAGALANLMLLLPFGLGAGGSGGAASGGAPLRVLLLNVHTDNTRHAAVRALIARESPDLVALLEVDSRWVKGLAPALAPYPGRIVRPRPDNFGIGLWSRHPMEARAVYYGPADVPSIRARVRVGGRPVTVVVTHPVPPLGARATAMRDAQLRHLVRDRPVLGRPLVVLGDLNLTPFGAAWADFVSGLGLRSARRGFGLQPTWPAGAWWLRIPIDHVLVSSEIGVADHRVGPDVGSDHLPLIADLRVPGASGAVGSGDRAGAAAP